MKIRNLAAIPLAAAILGLATSAHAATIAATGWNVDFILGSGETHATHDTPENANIWFAENSTVGVPGLPASGAVTVGGVDFQFEPFTGGTDNAVRAAGTLALTTPGIYSDVSFLVGNSGRSKWGRGTVALLGGILIAIGLIQFAVGMLKKKKE